MHLPQPTFTTVGSIKEHGFEKYNALVLPAFSTDDGAEADSSELSTFLLDKTGLTFKEIRKQWPDYSAKAGEVLEIPLTGMGKLTRLFVLGLSLIHI